LVDEFSQGITLRMEFERQSVEVEDFIRRRGRDPATTPVRDLVWTCPGLVFGLTVPYQPEIDAATMIALQKAFIDHLYAVRYATQDHLLGYKPRKQHGRSGLAEQLNQMNQRSAATVTSWIKLLHEEFRCMLEVSLQTIAQTLDGIEEEHFNRPASDAGSRRIEGNRAEIRGAPRRAFRAGSDRRLRPVVRDSSQSRRWHPLG